MSSSRLLILGVLKIRGPVHGYEIRRELESWRAEQWTNTAYGSIYYALGRMSEEGLVEVVGMDQTGKRPARTEYSITESGNKEFERLLREYWWERKTVIDPFQVALAFMNHMPRDELLAALRFRAEQMRINIRGYESITKFAKVSSDTPRHIAENMRLGAAHVETELRWTEEAIKKVERGELP